MNSIPREEMNQMINEVRAKVLADIEPELDQYDPGDVETLRNDDWQVERFILRKRNVPESAEMIKGTMKWRAELGIPQLTPSCFTQEFFKIASLFACGKDRNRNAMVYMRIRLHRKIPELQKHVKNFIAYTINKVDKETRGKGMAVVFDCQGAGLSNMDMDTLWFMVNSLIRYYPYGLQYVLVYEMPWILSSAWSIVKSWLPAEHRKKIRFASKKQIHDYIDDDNLPFYLGGKCPINYHQVPEECNCSAEDVAQTEGFTDKDVERLRKIFDPLLEEADEDMKGIHRICADSRPTATV